MSFETTFGVASGVVDGDMRGQDRRGGGGKGCVGGVTGVVAWTGGVTRKASGLVFDDVRWRLWRGRGFFVMTAAGIRLGIARDAL